jgi:dnd system-associated protein 4
MMAERIRPPAKFDGPNRVIDQLQEHGPFDTKQAVLMFAAALGYMHETMEPIDGYGEGIRWQVFERSQDDGYINAMAVAQEKSVAVLNEDEGESSKSEIFEQYAAAGLQYLNDRVLTAPGDVLDHLLALIRLVREAEQPPASLSGLSADDLTFLGV